MISKDGHMTGCISFVLLRGQVAVVDAADYPLVVSGFVWFLGKNGYVSRSEGLRRIYLHREIMNAARGEIIDHIDRDPLNNVRSNLRRATKSQNAHNSAPHRDSKSGIKGVCFDKHRNKWVAEIMSNGKRFRLGRFEFKEDAIAAYVAAATNLHGEFARTS